MENLSEVQNINLLKVDGVIRKARFKTADSVTELKEPVLHFTVTMCVLYVGILLIRKTCPLWLSHMAIGLEIFQLNYKT